MNKLNLLLFLAAVFLLHLTTNAASFTLAQGTQYSASTNPVPSLNNGDTLFIHDTLFMDSDYTTFESTRILLVIDGPNATIHWKANYDLKLGSGSSIRFYNGGDLTNDGPCNNNKSIFIGSNEVAACNGGNPSVLNFADIVSAGGLDSTGNPLPVTWLKTEALILDKEIQIKWATASEENNSHFEIQYSLDGHNWRNVGFIPSASSNGNSQQILNYSFKYSPSQIEPIQFYRIKQVDYNNQFSYSEVMRLQNISDHSVSIIGIGNGNIEVTAQDGKQVNLKIYSVTGKTIVDELINNERIFTMPNRGIYIVETTSMGQTQYYKTQVL